MNHQSEEILYYEEFEEIARQALAAAKWTT
jgi:hypothetical protein